MKHFYKKIFYIINILVINIAYSNDLLYNKLSNKSPETFVRDSDRYLSEAKSQSDKLNILYYTARSYFKLKENDKSIEYLVYLENELKTYGNYVESAKIYGELAYLYTYLNYTWKSKAMLEKSNDCIMKLSRRQDKFEAKSYFYFFKAKISSVNEDIENSIYYYKLSNDQYIQLSKIEINANPFLGHDIAVNLGDAYMRNKDLKSALSYNKLALKRYNGSDYSGTALLNIGLIYSATKKTDSALLYYKKSIYPLQSEDNIEYLNESFDSIKSIYTAKKNRAEADKYYGMQLKILNRLEDMDDASIQKKGNFETIYPENSGKYFILFFSACMLMLVLIILYVYLVKKQKKTEENKNFVLSAEKILLPEPEEPDVENAAYNQIAALLEEYEATHFYLSPNITLAKVAVDLNTNTRSLSEIINKNKQMNFNSYINMLRIDYVVKLLNEEAKYRNYKIAYLATVCGFSSHSTFTKIFKNIKGISPSEFIDIIKANSGSEFSQNLQ